MKKTHLFLLVLAAVLVSAVLLDQFYPRFALSGVKSIKVGDDKHAVERALGRPPSVYAAQGPTGNLLADILFHHGEIWSYESFLKFRCPTSDHWSPIGVNFRFFGRPDVDNLYVEFDASGRVKDIHVPTP